MKKLIYYPGFESTDENWIKFALLYVDQLRPILPLRADSKRSELYKKLNNETDFLLSHRPSFSEGFEASLDVIDICEKIVAWPGNYDAFFFNSINVIRDWKDKSKHDYILYEEKFSSDWFRYCVDNGYGTENDEGLSLSETLATLYMAFLANRIADNKNLSPITDSPHLDKLSYFLKQNAPIKTNETTNAQAIISLKLPKKIDLIQIDEVIRLRNSGSFKKYQAAFHDELKTFLADLETGDHSHDFTKKYNESSLNLTELILTLGQDTMTVGLGAWVLLNTALPQLPDVLKLVTTTSGVIIKQSLSINKTWRNLAPSRNCRRYLASLQAI